MNPNISGPVLKGFTRVHYSTKDPLLVIILAYQRTGSSFLGELFNQNPDAFYWFEPLEGAYSAMYGSKFGYSVPSDIFSNEDGTNR